MTIQENPACRNKVDATIAGLARRQHGVVSTEQLLRAGLTRQAIARRVAKGQLHRIHRGVYAVGHTGLGRLGDVWAAHLACPGALISHYWAAWLHGILEERPGTPVTVLTTAEQRSRSGIRVHRSSSLCSDDAVDIEQLPTTSAARTLLDMAATRADPRYLVRRAHVCGVWDDAAVRATLRRAPTHRGAARLRPFLGAEGPTDENPLQDRFLRLVRAACLPLPLREHRIGPYRVDFFWPAHDLVVETDGGTHANPFVRQQDAERDAYLQLRGITVLRFTFKHVFTQADYVMQTLRQALDRCRPATSPSSSPSVRCW